MASDILARIRAKRAVLAAELRGAEFELEAEESFFVKQTIKVELAMDINRARGNIQSVNWGQTAHLNSIYNGPLRAEMIKLYSLGWRFYVVEQSRGRCYYGKQIITIPLWAYKRTLPYINWYIAHECAHAILGKGYQSHGIEFMLTLKRICPEESQGYEFSYKPSTAFAAGLNCPADFME